MNDTTEYPFPHHDHDQLYVFPVVGWQHEQPQPLTPNMIAGIEAIVVEARQSGLHYIFDVELVIDGVRYWDRPDFNGWNKIQDWKPVVDCFPVHLRLQINEWHNIWASHRDWQDA